MYTEIFRIGRIAVYTYGLAMMLAFIFGILVAARRSRKAGIGSNVIWDISMLIMIVSLAGARLTYVFSHVSEFEGQWLNVVNPFQADGRIGIAGMTLLGGVIAAIAVAFWYVRRKKLNFWTLTDVMMPSLALGIGVGRLGCFFNGCCYGYPTHSWLGVLFPKGSLASYQFPNVPVLPTQLFEAAGAFLIFFLLLVLERRKKFSGFIFASFLIGYGILRSWVDTMRIDDAGDILWQSGTAHLTLGQAISAVLIVAGVWIIAKRKKA
ncbi:MAG: prolipoprotein diacylglyceryl transferase [bacterium]|nr:prolipoprotein diacylglyceryl transferase [bacterium]